MLHLQAQPTENQKEHALKNIKTEQFNDIIKHKKQTTFNRIRHLDEDLIYKQNCLNHSERPRGCIVWKVTENLGGPQHVLSIYKCSTKQVYVKGVMQ